MMITQATQLWSSIASLEVKATTSEVVIHETCYLLTSRNVYNVPSGDVVDWMRDLIHLPNLTFPGDDKAIYLRALDLWEEHPRLGFADAVIAARCERYGHELASFDRHFDALHGVRRWQPEAPS
jgi:predicted nucleic acid-binding protein